LDWIVFFLPNEIRAIYYPIFLNNIGGKLAILLLQKNLKKNTKKYKNKARHDFIVFCYFVYEIVKAFVSFTMIFSRSEFYV